MPVLRNFVIFLVLLLAPLAAFSTHIVGGVLNYAYNGNNVYTITLKLYRDCGSGTASFPSNITISVLGNNGAAFSPSKNLTINIGAVTTVTAQLDPCAQTPTPMPCVQQAIYSKTITLPPNTGGYHLYYQLEARNLSLTNINASCNCIGESFYAYIPNNTNSANNNSNPVFTSFPPLFLCAGQGFTVNNSATDADGDSLVYSLYAPYDGDNGAGSLDPTFSNNTASFTPVTYNTGYTYMNPLGASPFTINPQTGIITGTPGTVGQFVVGVKVKEYRNGVLVSETIRDFQFNVLNCPAPLPTLAVGNQTINNGCSKVVVAQGISKVSATWTSIYPGVTGAYNSYLSCTSNCLTNTINPTTSTIVPPPYVEFLVCGTRTNCLGGNICDTFRIDFKPPLSVSIAPSNPALCNGQTATTITAVGSGGTPPYSYLWNNVNPSQSISVGVGTYNVKLSDVSGCPPVYASAVVTSYSVPVTVAAGPDRARCSTSPVAGPLTATVTGASGVIWSGGTGTFSPNNTSSSNVFYTPTAAEIAAGSVTLIVTTTGSGACPSATDAVVISYRNFTGTVVPTTTAVTCFGFSNGVASLSVTGGDAPHTFTWQVTPSVTGSLLTGQPAGTYSFTILNSIGCYQQGSVTITQPPILGITNTVTNVTCFGFSNGSASVSANGGTAPYTYSWVPISQTGTNVSGRPAGSYSVTVTDNKNCTTTSVVTITQPSSISITASQTNVACFSASTAAISTSVTGGTAPYTYSWSPGGNTSPNLTSLPAGTYVLLVTDQNSCTATRSVVITQPTVMAVAMTATNETCSYLNNGLARATVSGGTPGYSYTWTPGSLTSSLATGLPAGNYTVTVKDANNCVITGTTLITEPPVLSVSLINYSPVRCFGQSNGSVTASANGGTPGYSYSWSPSGITTASLANRPAGSYTVVVTDLNTCTASAVQVITQPAALVQSATINTVSCNGGNNAAVTLSVSGGTAGYTYLWLPGAQSSATLSPASAGTYTAIVFDANSCSVSATYTVTEPQPIGISLTQNAVSCFGGNNGSVTSTITGGHAPYTYSWSTGATTSSVSNLTAGTYTIIVRDNLLCTVSTTVVVTQPTQLAISVSFTNETCDYSNNGIASASGSGGTPAYSYTWQPGSLSGANVSGLSAGTYTAFVSDSKSCLTSSVIAIQQPSTLVSALTSSAVNCFGGSDGMAFAVTSGGTANYQYSWTPTGGTLSTASGLAAGIYTLKTTDSKSCVALSTVQVTQPTSLTVNGIISNVSCFGGTNAAVSVTASGGTGPYSFLWSPSGQTSANASNLSFGTHTVFVTDAHNCPTSRVFTVTQPVALSISHTAQPVSCFGGNNGSITAQGVGGTAPYSYNWAHGPTTAAVSALSTGIYTVTVTDNLLCTSTKTIQVTEPAQFVLATSFTNETCDYLNNGAASVSGSGGTPAYTYTWLPGASNATAITNLVAGTYTVMAKDNNNCPAQSTVTIAQPLPLSITFSLVTAVSCNGGSNGSAMAVISGGTPNYSYTWSSGAISSALNGSLNAGTHSLTVTDLNGCTVNGTVAISQPNPLVITAIVTSVQCENQTNGSISLNINGGNPPYSNLIMPGNVSGSNFSNLAPGTYSIFSTDSRGCVSSTTVNVDQAIGLSTTVSFTNPSCGVNNGVATISVTSGGVPPFTYSWSPAGGTGSVATGIGPGSYTVSVTDSVSCVSTKIVDISNIGAPIITVIAFTNVSCYGGNDGAINTNISGGTPPLTYSWSPIGGTTNIAQNLTSGYYSLKVTDALGCIGFVTSTVIAEPPPLSMVVTPTAVACNGGNTGAASVMAAGGTPGYTFTWQSGVPAGTSVTGLTAGNYTVRVTDQNLCTHTVNFAITEPATLSLSVSSTSVSCFSGTNGAASGTASGATSPYNYSWTPVNVGGQNLQNVGAGIYSLTATDIKGCSLTRTVNVVQPTQVTLVTTLKNSDCSFANGQATVTATGGNPGYTYSWTPSGATNSVATGLLAGSHSVTVLDVNQCRADASFTLNDNPAPALSVAGVTNVSCFGGLDGAASASVTGGTAPFTYSWMPAGGTASLATGLGAGQYTVRVVSGNNCTVTGASVTITQPTPIFLSVSTTTVLCFGGNNGSATVTAFGGTGAYTYSWQGSASTSSTASGFTSGTYTVAVRDANNCPAVASFSIAQPQQSLSISVNTRSVSCNGGNNGSATVTPGGGTAPYNAMWMPGSVSSQTIFGMTAGNYSVAVTDVNGCSVQQTLNIAQPTSLTLTTNFAPSNCGGSDGQATVTAAGGTSPYGYQWSPSGGTASTAQNLAAGVYSVTVTDANTCVAVASTTITDLPAAVVSISSVTNVSCFGGTNGSATASVTGGTGPFTFTWSAGTGNTATVTGLPSGQHTVTVVSANGCTVNAVTPLVTQPSSIVINYNLTAVGCFGGNTGSAVANVFGGTSPYSYSWSPVSGTNSSVQGLAAGTYSLKVTDGNTCVANSTFVITQPSASLALSITSSSVLCFGGSSGSATVTASGGTSPYNYNWSPAASTASVASGLATGIHTITAVDNNGCSQVGTVSIAQPSQALSATIAVTNAPCFGSSGGSATVTVAGGSPGYTYTWSVAGTASVASGFAAGTHSVLVKDINQCTTASSFAVSEPAFLTTIIYTTNPSCGRSNGILNAQVNGGTGPFVYQWSAGSSTGPSLSGLPPGSYSLTVTDSHSCTTTATASLTNIPGPVVSVASSSDASCFGYADGSATISAGGGTPPFTYQWIPIGGNSVTATNLPAGTYSASVTDSLGCVTTVTAQVNQPAQLNIGVNVISDASCNGSSNGSINVTAFGGTSPYTYLWSSGDTSASADSLTAGTYTVNVTDAHSCSYSITAAVGEPAVLTSSAAITRTILCFGGTGDASVTVNGGTAPYAVNWNSSPPQNGNVLTSVPVGSYTVTVTDIRNCTTTSAVNFTQPSQIATSVSSVDTICANSNSILIASALGGVGNYTFTWAPDGAINTGTYQFSTPVDVSYTVVAFDQNGCAGSDAVSVVNVYNLTPSDLQLKGHSPICPGETSVLEAQLSGATGAVTYTWSHGLPSAPGPHTVEPTSATVYSVSVSNKCGFVVTKTYTVTINDPPVAIMTADSPSICVPGSIQFREAGASVNFADPVVEWYWDFGTAENSAEMEPSVYFTQPGVYSVSLTVRTDIGCVGTSSVPLTVTVFPQPVAQFSMNDDTLNLPYEELICTNLSSGAVSYIWTFGNEGTSTLVNPHILLHGVGSTQVQLIAISEHGCMDTTSQVVKTFSDIKFPNAFTPNPAGSNGGLYDVTSLDNDVFFPYTSGVSDFRMQIFNRWGELIFESTDLRKGWDGYYRGAICQQGVYVWKAHAKLGDGKDFDQTGTVTLLRK